MTLHEYKELLRKEARILDANWNPTELQLQKIQEEINKYINSGKKINVSTLQHIIISIYGPHRYITLGSVDNSDLNTLLSLATTNTQNK